MNIYIRYFDDEALCHNMDEMQEYLYSIPEIKVTEKMLNEIAEYAQSDIQFPKRYKVTGRNYFIMIKTPLETLAEFHANGKDSKDEKSEGEKGTTASPLDIQQEGWYQCTKWFKRIIPVDEDGSKMDYVDTSIEVLVHAASPRACHERIIGYLKNRPDLDPRCQFASPKESNFKYEYKGTSLN